MDAFKGNANRSGPSPAGLKRGTFLKNGLLAVFGLVAAARGAAFAEAAQAPPKPRPQAHPEGTTPVPFRFIEGKPALPPLDTPLLFARQQSNPQFCTHQVLALVMEEHNENSFPWVQYNQLTTSHTGGDACGFYSRVYKQGPGWSAGVHSEIFSSNWGVGIGVNIEVSNDYEGQSGFNGIFGAVILSLGKRPAKAGLLLGGKQRFEHGLLLQAATDTGLDLQGDCNVGLNLHHNRLRLAEGAWLDFDEKGEVRLRYWKGKLEFFKGDKRVAYLPLDKPDHEL